MANINRNWPWPANVGTLGTYPEEVRSLRKLENDPQASPLPHAAPNRLLKPVRSSDHLRMGDPPGDPSEADPSTPTTPMFVVFRRVLTRRRKKGWRLFEDAVDDEPLDDELPDGRREQMRSMLRRESAMLETLEHFNGLAEAVYSRLLSESKG